MIPLTPRQQRVPPAFAALLRPIPAWTHSYEDWVEYNHDDLTAFDTDTLRRDLLRCELRAALEVPCHWWIHDRIRALRAALALRDTPPAPPVRTTPPSDGSPSSFARTSSRYSTRGGGSRG